MLPMSESKIAVPALPDLCVSRPRLLAALGRGAERGEDSVTLVCAPLFDTGRRHRGLRATQQGPSRARHTLPDR
jgi:hypothetical protein